MGALRPCPVQISVDLQHDFASVNTYLVVTDSGFGNWADITLRRIGSAIQCELQ